MSYITWARALGSTLERRVLGPTSAKAVLPSSPGRPQLRIKVRWVSFAQRHDRHSVDAIHTQRSCPLRTACRENWRGRESGTPRQGSGFFFTVRISEIGDVQNFKT